LFPAAILEDVGLNPSSISKVMVRATNWVGDAVMSLPAIRAIRERLTHAELAVVARPWVAGVYARETAIDRIIPYEARGWRERIGFGLELGRENFDCAILLQNALDAAAMAWLAGIPERIGYRRDGRGWLLTRAVAPPQPGEIPRHERFYYLELLRRAGLIEDFPPCDAIRLDGAGDASEAGRKGLALLGLEGPFIGVSPGAAYGNAKRWVPERFADAAVRVARELRARVLLFGSPGERDLAGQVAAGIRAAGVEARNFCGETSLAGFIEFAANCRVFLTNDSGAMHIASALGVPTVAVFGATDDTTTGPTGPLARVVREHAECSPCLLRECPIDHRCMTAVAAERVVRAALELVEESAASWTPDARS
jgi:heptosyltransferase II